MSTACSAIDVVADLTQDPLGKVAPLLEAILAADEGPIRARYHLRVSPDVVPDAQHATLLHFIARKDARLIATPPALDYSRELVAAERGAENRWQRQRAQAKPGWALSNAHLVSALLEFDELVYLNQHSVPLRHGWLAALVESARGQAQPYFGATRHLRTTQGLACCGWAATGWYQADALRTLDLEEAFATRMANPWREQVDPRHWHRGAGFCLAGDWISGFDVPADYWLYALWHARHGDPASPLHRGDATDEAAASVWAEGPDDGVLQAGELETGAVLAQITSSAVVLQRALRRLFRERGRQRLAAQPEPALSQDMAELPLGAPALNLLAGNRLRFELAGLRDLFRGERCFIIGNGPSLRQTDLQRLRQEYTIGLNRIYLNYPNMGFQTSMLCVTNENVLRQFAPEIDALDSLKFLSAKSRSGIENQWNTWFMQSVGFHEFHKDLAGRRWCDGCTVTYCAMQVAYYLGFSEVVLVGVDHGFANAGQPHQLVTAEGPDANHFHPDYFGKGVQWQYPDLAGSELSYRIARRTFEDDGRRILDATIGGQLQVFDKVDFDEITRPRP